MACLVAATAAARASRSSANGKVIKVRSKDRVDLKAGDILTLYSSGGGGYGPASERDPGLVAHDLAEGFVSSAAAAQSYGRT